MNAFKVNAETVVKVSSRKSYSSSRLADSFSKDLTEFFDSTNQHFTPTHQENIRRRCVLFLKYIQAIGKDDVSEITFKDIYNYHHDELAHLKPMSRMIEEGTIAHLLFFLSTEKGLNPSLGIYMYALETDTFIGLSSLDFSDQEAVKKNYPLHISHKTYHQTIDKLIADCMKIRYAPPYVREIRKALRYFELFLDYYGLDYSPEIGSIWLNSQKTKEVFQGRSWAVAGRALFLLKNYVTIKNAGFSTTQPRGLSGIYDLPAALKDPLLAFAKERSKEKLDDDTVKNDIYSILRFCRFLVSIRCSSYHEVSSDMLLEFNLYDHHRSSEGKNACNCRIRRFLRYLYQEKIIDDPSLSQVLGYAAMKSEKIITILTSGEIAEIKNYISEAKTPLQLRDSAMMLLGTEMGIRGCDIVRLKIPDINFKKKAISFVQDKTNVEIQLAMPDSVGNAIYRYLKLARPRNIESDFLFVSLHVPYRSLTRNVCYRALKKMLPEMGNCGSGFHITRRTFPTYKLREGIAPERISSAIGQRDVKSLTPYLSLDDERLSKCPLSLADLGIPMKGGFL